MNLDLQVSESIMVNGSVEQVWDAIINPEKIAHYLYGTETITDWKVGSPIIFQGEYEGHKYKDKGNVLENTVNTRLSYNYWSGFSKLPDAPENYQIVVLEVEKMDENTAKFTWTQKGFANETARQHMVDGMSRLLGMFQEVVEQSASHS